MSTEHFGGNIQNAIILEEHDGTNNAKRVNVVAGGVGQATVNINGSATIFAVVNTGASSDPKSFIGLTTAVIGSAPTIFAVVNTTAAGQASVVLDTSANWVGLASVSGNVGISGNVTLSDSKSYIGLVSVSHAAWADPKTYIGLTTSTIGSAPTLFAVVNDPVVADPKIFMGLVTAVVGSSPTIYAVVNTSASASGNVTLDAGSKTQIIGNVTLSDSTTYIGLTTTTLGEGKRNIGLVTLNASASWIGLTTTIIGNAPILGNSTNYIGLVTVANTVPVTFSGNVTLSDAKTYVGLTTTTLGVGTSNIGLVTTTLAAVDTKSYLGLTTTTLAAVDTKSYLGLVTTTIGVAPILGASTNYIGLVTVANTVTVAAHALTAGAAYIGLVSANIGTIAAGANYIGLASVNIGGTLPAIGTGVAWIGLVTASNGLAWADPKTWIGLVTADIAHAWVDPTTFIGLATTVNGAGTQFMGLVTAWTRNAGSAKTLTNLPIAFSLASLCTCVVPGTNLSVNVTNMVLSSDATVRLAIKSGATYMTGNASIGVTLMPGGGFVLTGSPDSPSWIGLPSGAMTLEKQDIGGTIARIGGHVVYFTE